MTTLTLNLVQLMNNTHFTPGTKGSLQLQGGNCLHFHYNTVSLTLLPPDSVSSLTSYTDYSSVQFKDSLNPTKDKLCSICRDSVGRYSTVLQCGHEFHYSCLSQWLRTGHTCPICRKDHAFKR